MVYSHLNNIINLSNDFNDIKKSQYIIIIKFIKSKYGLKGILRLYFIIDMQYDFMKTEDRLEKNEVIREYQLLF